MRAGVPLVQALSILDEQMDNPKLKKILQSVYDDLQKGKGLSESLSMHEKALPSIMIKLIEAGELSGTLDLSLERLAVHFEKEYKIAKKIKSAMMYPTIISIVALLVVIFMLVFVIPRFMGFFENSDTELPGITKFFLGVSNAVTNDWMYILGIIGLIAVAFKVFKSTQQGQAQD